MKKYGIIAYCIMLSLTSLGQPSPRWINDGWRESSYPQNVYFTSFISDFADPRETTEKATARMEAEAKRKLSESIRVKVKSEQTIAEESSERNGAPDQFLSIYSSAIKTSSDAEIVGLKVETFYDKQKDVVYAFAYANKFELTGYYKANINMLLQQAEGLLQTAVQLESSKEKAKARKQCAEAIPLLAKARYAQDMLTALSGGAGSESLQQETSERLRSEATQMLARLAQGLYLYVESDEDLFGKKVSIVGNHLKAILARNGCSFTDDAAQADLKLTLSTATRTISNADGIVFCYADTEVALYDNFKQKNVFSDEASQKGGGASPERAGRQAMESIAPQIADKIMPWIRN
ncbi:MAG: hypothetical protein LBK18_05525 [Prevotellaceae bacterium]|jgi:hypothetical protein|nr:hypothetical protein [Prevotellaceae bacterium]